MNDSRARDVVLHVRCDGGPALGLGHVVGSLRLARLIDDEVTDVRFHCRPDRATRALVEAAGYVVETVPTDITPTQDVSRLAELGPGSVVAVNLSRDDLLARNELFQRIPAAGVPLVFQDNPIPPGWRTGDVVINALPHPAYDGYDPRLHPRCLDGLAYFLPDPGAAELRATAPARRFDQVRRVLVAMGGGSSAPATSAVLGGLAAAGFSGEVDVVVGAATADLDVTRTVAADSGLDVSVTVGADDLPARMLAADIGFSALGLTTYEMAYMGLPALLVTASELNAAAADRYCDQYGAAIHIGGLGEATPDAIATHVRALTPDAQRRRVVAERGRAAVGSATEVVRRTLHDLLRDHGSAATRGR